MANEDFFGKVLYNKKMSEDWLLLLEDTTRFNRFDLKTITALLSAPCDLGTLIIREEARSFSDDSPLNTLETFFRTHRFFDYELTRRCFTAINEFPTYKVPFVNWHFVLFPIEQLENSTWLNPLEIYDVRMIQGKCYAELNNGLILELPVKIRSFIGQSEKAIYLICYLRREYSITAQPYDSAPLDYIKLPDTPFLRSLRKRPLLQDWITKRGVFHQRYLSETVLKYRDLID